MASLLSLTSFTVLCSPAAAEESPESQDLEAREFYRQGELHYAAGRYLDASIAFEEAFGLSQRPQLLFNLANTHERMGELIVAARYLRRFLKHPDSKGILQPQDVVSIRGRIVRLEETADLRKREKRQQEQAVEKAARRRQQNHAPPGLSTKPMPESAAGAGSLGAWLAVAVGAAAVISAVVFGTLSRGAAEDVEAGCAAVGGKLLCSTEEEGAAKREKRFALISDISSGVALVSLGVGTYLMVWPSPAANPTIDGSKESGAQGFVPRFVLGVQGVF